MRKDPILCIKILESDSAPQEKTPIHFKAVVKLTSAASGLLKYFRYYGTESNHKIRTKKTSTITSCNHFAL